MVSCRKAGRSVVVLGGALALAACAVAPPAGPTVMAVPQKGESLSQFQRDDLTCRQYASAQIGGATPAQAATNSAVGSAALGTALGAAAGAAIGSVGGAVGAGAAIGAATGLLAGSAIGAGNAAASVSALQQRYNISYTQCMVAYGDEVRPAPGPYPAYGYAFPAYGYAFPAYGYAFPAYGYPYGYPFGYAPFVVAPSIGLGWGRGWGGGSGWRRGSGWRGGRHRGSHHGWGHSSHWAWHH